MRPTCTIWPEGTSDTTSLRTFICCTLLQVWSPPEQLFSSKIDGKDVRAVSASGWAEFFCKLLLQTAGGAKSLAWQLSCHKSSCCWWRRGPFTVTSPSPASCTQPSSSPSIKSALHRYTDHHQHDITTILEGWCAIKGSQFHLAEILEF